MRFLIYFLIRWFSHHWSSTPLCHLSFLHPLRPVYDNKLIFMSLYNMFSPNCSIIAKFTYIFFSPLRSVCLSLDSMLLFYKNYQANLCRVYFENFTCCTNIMLAWFISHIRLLLCKLLHFRWSFFTSSPVFSCWGFCASRYVTDKISE